MMTSSPSSSTVWRTFYFLRGRPCGDEFFPSLTASPCQPKGRLGDGPRIAHPFFSGNGATVDPLPACHCRRAGVRADMDLQSDRKATRHSDRSGACSRAYARRRCREAEPGCGGSSSRNTLSIIANGDCHRALCAASAWRPTGQLFRPGCFDIIRNDGGRKLR